MRHYCMTFPLKYIFAFLHMLPFSTLFFVVNEKESSHDGSQDSTLLLILKCITVNLDDNQKSKAPYFVIIYTWMLVTVYYYENMTFDPILSLIFVTTVSVNFVFVSFHVQDVRLLRLRPNNVPRVPSKAFTIQLQWR